MTESYDPVKVGRVRQRLEEFAVPNEKERKKCNNFAAFLSHMKFVKNHHQKIKKIAAVTDSSFLSIMPQVANHFIKAEVRHFDYADRDAALNWLKTEE